MKIIKISSNIDTSDVLIYENVNEFYGREFINLLTTKFSNKFSSIYFVLAPDDQPLCLVENGIKGLYNRRILW